MQSGLAHGQDSDHPIDGSMAIFCPACPQPGLNLPDDWQKRYNQYVFHMHVTYAHMSIYNASQKSSHPNLYYGWKLLCRAYEVPDK